MLKHRLSAPVALAILVSVTACEGLREAMTAHVDVAARADGQELSVQRFGEMLANTQLPLAKPVAEQVAYVWVNYQLLAKAAANHDSLADTVLIDRVMWPAYSSSKARKWMDQVQAGMVVDTSNIEAAYNEGTTFLSARHILFALPQDQQQAGSDSVMRRAESVLRQVNDRNFAALARQHSGDPSNKDTGGDLGVFAPQQMVPEFSRAVAALRPGEIGPLVRTNYGYHIIRRNTFAEAREQFSQMYAGSRQRVAESTYVAGVEASGNVEIRPNAARVVKEVAMDVDAHKGDRTPLASSRLGNFTAGDFVRFLNSLPQRERMREQIQQAPDSQIPTFVRSLVLNDLLLQQADSAGITVDTAEVNAARSAFKAVVINTWEGLQITPKVLDDSAQTRAERERVGASLANGYMERLLQQQVGYIEVPPPLAEALRDRYDASLKPAGIQRALEVAQKLRAAADSTRAAAQPKSAVPMPDTGRR